MLKKKRRQIVLATLVCFGAFWLLVLYNQLTLPDVATLKIQNPKSTAFMQRYKGEKPLQYVWIPYLKISPSLKEAVIVSEDGSFFQHHGFDWEAIRLAFLKNWRKKGFVRGGSTITQQLAKNLYLSPSKNPLRKIKETLITIRLEQTLSKQRILEIYLNVVEWGDGIYGAEAASQHYFNTKAASLTASQSAWLAAILPNPTFYEKRKGGRFIQAKADKILSIMGYRRERPETDKGYKELPTPVAPPPQMEQVPTDVYDAGEIAPEEF